MAMHILKLLNTSLVTTSRNLFCRSSTFSTMATLPDRLQKPMDSQKNSCKQTDISVNQVFLEVIGSGGSGAPRSVMLVTNYGPYLINCGEGTTKLSGEYKIKFHKSQNVFITYPSWENISGLFGMALAVQESKGTEFFIHGDTDIESLFYSVNKLVNLRHLRVKVRNCSHYSNYSDGVVSVKYVFLYPSLGGEMLQSESSMSTRSEEESLDSEEFNPTEMGAVFKKNKRDRSVSKKKVSETKQNQITKASSSPKEEQAKRKCMNYAISYIFQTQGSYGTLNIEKCLEHGVPPGPLLGQLKSGLDVTLENGNIVKSTDVKTPDLPGVNVIALECPSEDYLDTLLQESAFYEFQSEETPAEAVVHFSSADIVKNPKYQEWISRFPATTLHLFINEENKGCCSVAIHRQQYKLNFLHPKLFPMLNEPHIPDFPRTDNTIIQTGHTLVDQSSNFSSSPIYKDIIFLKCENNNFINGETLCKVNLKPKRNYDYTRSIVLKKEAFFNEMFESEEIKQKIEEGQQKVKDAEESIKTGNGEYPKIVFLGTGSSKPSKVRNGSGILIFTNSSKCILLDCGEYTFGQLMNFYGLSKTRKILRSLEAIYVSHLHLDHHMGLITLLKERKLAFDELTELPPKELSSAESSRESVKGFSPVFLLGPFQIVKWLNLYSEKLEDISELYDLIPNCHMLFNNNKVNHKSDACKKKLGMTSMATVPVIHCPNSFGISMIHKNGWKITYSGDTRPCQALIDMGMNSDILIHEATLEDAYSHEAKVKLHSTTSEAIDVGMRMKAKYILLTHFSQRYCHLPNIDSSVSNLNVGIAFDFMEVPFNKLPLLPTLIKPLQYAFSKYDELNKTTVESFLLRKGKVKNQRVDLKDLFDFKGTPAKVSKVKC